MGRTRWTAQDRAKVAGLSVSGLNHKQIAERTGIPRRTVTAILGRTPVVEVVTVATREQVSARLWEVVAAGTQEALRRIADPRTRAGELAQLLKVAAEQHALLVGDVTSRTEQIAYEQPRLTYEQEQTLREWLDAILAASDDDLAAAIPELLPQIRDAERTALDIVERGGEL